jgi:hypothetical protein
VAGVVDDALPVDDPGIAGAARALLAGSLPLGALL